MKNFIVGAISLLLFISCHRQGEKHDKRQKDPRPNILLIMADDMGYTDVGCFGSEIETPNIDALADRGMLFTNFHTSVSCSPTRSMLMSGTDNHIAGMGNMSELLTENQIGQPGYEGHLNDRVVSMAEIFRSEGYHTYMAGKWHLGHEPEYTPYARGFERSFSMLQGGASHWSDMFGLQAATQPYAKYVLDDEELMELPKDFYSSRTYADFLLDAIRDHRDDGKPFLAYYAPTAAHDPIHVPEPWLTKYRGMYDEGYEVLKERRIENTKKLGLIPESANSPDFHPLVTQWGELNDHERALRARTMEAYSGMIDNLDYHIGRILSFLKDVGEIDNTIIIFTSDNGPNPWEAIEYPSNEGSEWFEQFDNSLENIGRPGSFVGIGMGWAQASAGPFDYFKMTTGEGGIRTPLIISGPGVSATQKSDAFTYVTDILPTLLEVANIDHPNYFNSRKIEPMRGHSIVPILSNTKNTIYSEYEIICGEMGTGKWARKGDFKAVLVAKNYSDGTWRLYNTKSDPGETDDLSSEMPDLLTELKNAWNEYGHEVGVIE
jgi:arylsulfatase